MARLSDWEVLQKALEESRKESSERFTPEITVTNMGRIIADMERWAEEHRGWGKKEGDEE